VGGKGVTPLKCRKKIERGNALGDKRARPMAAHRENVRERRKQVVGFRFQLKCRTIQ